MSKTLAMFIWLLMAVDMVGLVQEFRQTLKWVAEEKNEEIKMTFFLN